MSRNNSQKFRGIYLGNEPMGELLEGENGSDAVQVPLRRMILRTGFNGQEVGIKLTDSALVFNSINTDTADSESINLPIDYLAYCGALKQIPQDRIEEREFETLDKYPSIDENDSSIPPPLFVTIFRCTENDNMLFCHAFVLKKDDEAMDLVKSVMSVYYELSKMFDDDDDDDITSGNDENKNEKTNNDDDESNDPYLTKLIQTYNNIVVGKKGDKPKSQTDILSTLNLDLNKFQIVKSRGQNYTDSDDDETDKQSLERLDLEKYTLNEDKSPIVIKKKNDEEVVYKQNVYIRWLQPPTPPPPAPLISKFN
jgi:hypothetical protein